VATHIEDLGELNVIEGGGRAKVFFDGPTQMKWNPTVKGFTTTLAMYWPIGDLSDSHHHDFGLGLCQDQKVTSPDSIEHPAPHQAFPKFMSSGRLLDEYYAGGFHVDCGSSST